MSGLRDLVAAATPGPWEHRVWGTPEDEWPHRRVSVGTTTGHGDAVYISPRYGHLEQSVADARLIALAPELAVLCADLVEALERAAHLVSHLVQQVPEFTGVIGPGGEREDDYIRDGIGMEAQAWREGPLARFAVLDRASS